MTDLDSGAEDDLIREKEKPEKAAKSPGKVPPIEPLVNNDEIYNEIYELVMKLQLVQTDLEISEEVIGDAVKDKDLSQLHSEMKDVEKLANDYAEMHLKILKICMDNGLPNDEYKVRHKKFLIAVKRVKGLASQLLTPISLPQPNPTSSADVSSHLKLAKIEIELFDGSQENWPRFKTVFETFVHSRDNWTNLEKHKILLSKLSGPPYLLIHEIPLDPQGSHYNAAWEAILDQYDDPLQNISRYIKALDTGPKDRSLKNLVAHYRANFIPLRVVFQRNPNIDILSQFCIHSFLRQADKGANIDWQREVEKRQELPTFDHFVKFMTGRCNSYERAVGQSNKSISPSNKSGKSFSALSKNHGLSKCQLCKDSKEPHMLHRCSTFLKMSPEERMQFIKKKTLCRKCFRGKCSRRCRFMCQTCNGHHNTLLHICSLEKGSHSKKSNDGEFPFSSMNSDNPVIICDLSCASQDSAYFEIPLENMLSLLGRGWVGSLMTDNLYSLLATAIVRIDDASQNKQARAIIDSGSQFNFISRRLAQELKFPTVRTSVIIHGIENYGVKVDKSVALVIRSRNSNFKLKVNCLILEEIADLVPAMPISLQGWSFPTHLSLADPTFNMPNSVDLLLGLGVFWKIIKPNFRHLGTNLPTLIATEFGWLVSGDMDLLAPSVGQASYVFFHAEDDLSDENLSLTIQKLWLIEENKSEFPSLEQLECEQHFLQNTVRDADGRFRVRLPFKLSPANLGSSRQFAFKRFFYLEKRFLRDPEYKQLYVKCIRSYLEYGHMKEASTNSLDEGYYLPHHGVLKHSSTSTVLRVVFNASMCTTSGLSLNQLLMIGPVVQSDLVSILIRSRFFAFAFSADIVQMYRQIRVDERDLPFQKILWRESPREPLKEYELTTVTFGVASASYLATRCLKKLAEDSGNKYPLAEGVLLRDFYVDDVFTGADSLEEVLQIKNQLIEMLSSAGFCLSKWCSNHPSILQGISIEHLEKQFPLYFGNEHVVKTLGLMWFPSEDTFRVWVRMKDLKTPTKRQVLSIISAIFDPLGFLSPVTIVGKILMQSLWKPSSKNLSWDDRLPDDINEKWWEFSSTLGILNDLSIPRHIFSKCARI